MLNLKIILLGMLVAVACVQAGGAASVVAKKSKAKGFSYSYETQIRFVEECSQGANRNVCECVFRKIKLQYSENDYWRLENDLQKNINHPDYIAYLTTSVEECDEETANDDSGRRGYGYGDGLAGLYGGFGGGIATKAKGNIKTPSARDVEINSGGGSRSAADIMKVVRQRTPGLRHIYNKFLKIKPGFQGKITLKFTVAPRGEVISVSVVSSTTGYGEFDAQIKEAVGNWTFNKVKSGNTTVSIPFTFSE
ncbi:TonB family C-terminal domain-containing protein [Fibrobacter sp. UWT3]|uniref:AgmX/PglI C-terminal domain-containing protein n=1 Tax=Fibrobacter sp. UWT3 TaxID=1896225 RepID=UPI000BDA3403|nr:AgmX/PglI C-terminal domain-containing protein [Fibrobacter sp. UWT3]SOE79407.1 TonB family C-terminal domain-containing protein [Fibrobacter sp. UWT3]